MKKTKTLGALLVRVLTAFNELKLREAYLEDGPQRWQHGMIDANRTQVTINPAPHVVDTLIHEILHAIEPDWSETTVRRMTTRLMRKLTHAEVKQIYEEYASRKD